MEQRKDMGRMRLTSEDARRKAESRFRREKARKSGTERAYEDLAKVQEAELVKTERLRALRLTKEAADAGHSRHVAEAKAATLKAARSGKTARLGREKSDPEV